MNKVTYMRRGSRPNVEDQQFVSDKITLRIDKEVLPSDILLIEKICREIEGMTDYPLLTATFTENELILRSKLSKEVSSMEHFKKIYDKVNDACFSIFNDKGFICWSIEITSLEELKDSR